MNPTGKELANRLEEQVARDIGGRIMPASGSRWGSRRDVKSAHWLVEAKTTGRGSQRIGSLDLEYLQRQAYRAGLTPAFVVEFQQKGLVALVPNDVTAEEASVLVDVIDKSGWAFSYEEVAQTKIPLVVRFPCGVYIAMPYERFLQITADFVA